MAADGLTKALSAANHESFVRMTGIEDSKDLLATKKREEDLKDSLQQQRAKTEYRTVTYEFGANAT